MLTDLLEWAQRKHPGLLVLVFRALGVHEGTHDWLGWCECAEFDCPADQEDEALVA